MWFYRRNLCCNVPHYATRYYSIHVVQPLVKLKPTRIHVVACSNPQAGVRGFKYHASLASYRNTAFRSSSLSTSSTRNIPLSNVERSSKWPFISRPSDAESLLIGMSDDELQILSTSMKALEEKRRLERDVEPVHKPTARQLMFAGINNSIPFVGFGFLDNAIMIVAGDYIDTTIGVSLGISTMAAAAIGNIISDTAGISLAGYVEEIAGRFGVEEPNLTLKQLGMKSTKRAEYLGRAIGIIVGCVIGMFPLLFLHHDTHDPTKDVTEEV